MEKMDKKTYSPTGGIESEILINEKGEGYERKFYPNGKLKLEVPYVDWEINGVVKEYWENGKPRSKMPFKNTEMHGTSKYYDENGNLVEESTFSNGFNILSMDVMYNLNR